MRRLSTSGKVLATMAVLGNPADATILFRFAPASEEEALTRYARRLQRRMSEEGEGALVAELRELATRESFSHLRDVHPGWIFEYIRDESPRVIGLVLRYLPGDKVRYLIEHLPPKVRRALPTVGESFAIPEELINEVKRALERRFVCGTRPAASDPFSLYHIPWMSLRDLQKLITELGLRELSAAFSRASAKGLKAFLARFPVAEAGRLKERILRGGEVSAAERQEAQRHLATANLSVTGAADLPYEIGLSILAESAWGESADWIDPLILKLAPAQGYVLKRYLKEGAALYRPERAARRQGQLLGLIRSLADAGEISHYWYSGSEETTGSYPVR